MRNPLFVLMFMAGLFLAPGLLAGTGAAAADLSTKNTPQPIFSGALAYDSLAVPDRAPGQGNLSAGAYSVDLYRGEIGPMGLSLGTGFQTKEGDGEPDFYTLGLRVDYGGLSLVSQWRGADDGLCGLSDTACSAGPAFNIGASYTTGAASLSAQYQAVNPLGAEDQKPVGDVFRFGIDYQLFDGISSRADAYYINGDDGLTSGDSTVVLIGTRITF